MHYAENRRVDWPGILGCGLILGLLALLAMPNSAYPFALFMDERITYDPIHKALNGSLADALVFFFDGQDARYGRLLWNLDFLASVLPFSLAGEQGQIIATRLMQCALLLAGYRLMTLSLLRREWLRWLCLLCLLLLPPSYYYFLMPKPEPEIIFVLGLILYAFHKKAFHAMMILCGVLAGLKLSMLPLSFVLIVQAYLRHASFNTALPVAFKQDLRIILRSRHVLLALFLSAGIGVLLHLYVSHQLHDKLFVKLSAMRLAGIGVYPVFLLANALFAGFVAMLLLKFAGRAFAGLSFGTSAFLRLLAGFAICNPYTLFAPYNIGLYLTTSVSHGGDKAGIGFAEWMQHIYSVLLFDNPYLTALFIFCVLVLLYLSATRIRHFNRTFCISADGFALAVFLLTLVPVVFFTQRIWGFYLLLPAVFCVLIVFRFSEKWLGISRLNPLHALLPLVLFYLASAGPVIARESHATIAKEQGPVFRKKVLDYQAVCRFINTFPFKSDKPKVFWDPNLFYPDGLKTAEPKIFWGPFKAWSAGSDLVVLSGYPDQLYRPEPGVRNADQKAEAIQAYRLYTRNGTYVEMNKGAFPGYVIFARQKQ